MTRAVGAGLRPVLRKHHPSGEVVETEAFDLWTFEHEKCASLVEYIDTALAERFRDLALQDATP